jgi:hypothetical protein
MSSKTISTSGRECCFENDLIGILSMSTFYK